MPYTRPVLPSIEAPKKEEPKEEAKPAEEPQYDVAMTMDTFAVGARVARGDAWPTDTFPDEAGDQSAVGNVTDYKDDNGVLMITVKWPNGLVKTYPYTTAKPTLEVGPPESKPEPAKDQTKQETQPLPEGWTEHVDEGSQKTYYYNAALNQTQWERPAPDEEIQVRPDRRMSQFDGGSLVKGVEKQDVSASTMEPISEDAANIRKVKIIHAKGKLGLFIKGVKVIKVTDGSRAHTAGIQVDWIVKKVGDVQIPADWTEKKVVGELLKFIKAKQDIVMLFEAPADGGDDSDASDGDAWS